MKVELNSGIHILKKGFILLCILLYSCTQEALEQIKAPEPSGWTEEEVASLLAFKVGRFEYNTNTGNNFDNTAIAILNHIPSDKSTDVNVAEKVTVEFSEALDANSINENTVILSQNGTRISANTSVEGKILRITPTSPLSYDTNYTLLLTTGIKDEKGNQIQSDYSFQFHTAQKKDSIPPEITATDPVSGQTGILSGHTILVTFSEELSADSVSADTIQITTDTGNIDKNYTVSGNVLQIIASPYLPTQKKISLSIKKEISDLAGNPMSSDYEFFFYTADDIPPTVKATNPTNNASMVSPNSKISILFSEVLDYNTVNAATVLFQKDGVPVEATIELKDDTIWISPLSSLELTANYTVTLTGGLKDLYGNALAENYTFSFQSYSLNLQVAAGYTSTCAIIPPGNLKCWGMGSFGILGNGDTANILSISEAVRLNFGFFITVEQVSVGISHACAVLSNKKVKCWGDGAYGKLGDPNISEIIDINEALYLPFPEDIVQIQTGSFSTCALSVSGKVYCFGINFNGQLGNSNNLDITDASKAIPISFNPKAIKISSGNNHTCALLEDKTLRCWGANYAGQLGYGDRLDRNDAATLSAVDVGGDVADIIAGSTHTCAILSDESAKCWGDGVNYQNGDGSGERWLLLPKKLNITESVTEIAAGNAHTCLLLQTGKLRCFGKGTLQAGIPLGYAQGIIYQTPETAPDISFSNSVIHVYARGEHTCALLSTGALKCWGWAAYGQLGYGNTDNIYQATGAGDLYFE